MKKRSRLQTTGKFIIMVLLLTIAVSLSHGQQRKAYNLSRLGKEKKLVTTRPLKPIADGSKDGVSLDGIAWLKGIEFTDGTIEVDLRGKDLFQRSFVGIAFHGVDTTNYDAVYFRPFNFRSDDSVRRIHAVQYMHPPKLDWFVLREQFPGRYEKAVNPAPLATEWFHAKIVVKGPKIRVFVNNSDVASLEVDKLNDRKSGLIGLWSNGSESDFANLVITKE